MKLPTLATFCDVTATTLLLTWLLWGAWFIGGQQAQLEVREYCDGLNVVLLNGDRYECVSAPKSKQP